MDALEPRFQEASYPAHSYPELSLEAWLYKDPTAEGTDNDEAEHADEPDADVAGDDLRQETARTAVPIVPYSAEDILKDGCFLDRAEIDALLGRLRVKKNLILQGPPGTGKTWLAKRLAFALMGQKDESKIRAVQFHPNLSYEDFVRGWRPTGEGKLSLVDGIFMEAIKAGSKDPSSRFVVVIEEINRGNPAQIFGELLTLLEAGKRTPNDALELCYPDADGKRRPVHIPENLYIIGTMNVADRSLALVDLALRRRFAFVDLEPRLGTKWRDWVVAERAVASTLVTDIERRIGELNERIAADARLGKQFRIGHSYVTPAYPLEADETRKWFQDVVETEIGPLLEEYWFDAPGEAQKACERLMQDW
jgi:5-methylcytosine-specific restriction protein B